MQSEVAKKKKNKDALPKGEMDGPRTSVGF